MVLVLFGFLAGVLAVTAAGAAAILGELALRRLLRAATRRSVALGLLRRHGGAVALVVIIGAALATPKMAVVLLHLTESEGRHVSPGEAVILGGMDVPAEASDVNYLTDYMVSGADFRISEDAFRRWCAAEGLTPEDITQRYGLPVDPWSGRKGIGFPPGPVANGLICHTPRHPRGTGATLLYDRDAGRAYYRYDAW